MQLAKIVTITGTNGKGSTARMLESLLLTSGKTVGVLITPKVTTVLEMFSLNGKPPTLDVFNRARAGHTNLHNQHKELVDTALEMFKHCEYIILEAFVGGKDDATNTVDADAVIITNIANDHIPSCGKDLEELALNKAHLFRENAFAIIGREATQRSIRDYANKVGAKMSVEGVHFHTHGYSSKIHDSNIALAVEVCRVFGVTSDVNKALDNVRGVGYFDKYDWNGVTVIADSCHNEHGVRYFVDKIKDEISMVGEVYTISPFYKDKSESHTGMIDALNEVTTQWVSPKMKLKRLLYPQEMAKLVPALQFKSLEECVKHLEQVAKEGDVIIACGSLPIPHEIKELITKEL